MRITTGGRTVAALLWALCLSPLLQANQGLTPLADDEMSAVSGAGLAVALEDFRFMMAPTSYAEQVGIAPTGACSGSGGVASNTNCWRRGDLRWYGVSISGAENLANSGMHWDDATACNPGSSAMSCPRGGVIGGAGGWFSPFDNPYLMRAWSPEGLAYDGSAINADSSNPDKTIYEFLAPTEQPDYLFAFWGEIEAGATRNPASQALTAGTGVANGGGLLKSQTLIRGNAAGSVFRLFKFAETGASPVYGETFAMYYHSRLQGDFRFSVAQAAAGGTDTIGEAPVFEGVEGLHFRNVDAFLPFGQLYYQALVLDAVGTTGNFSLSLTKIPETPAVYNPFYSLDAGDVRGFQTALTAVRDWNAGCGGDQTCETWRTTHGYVRYGDWYPGNAAYSASSGTRNAINDTTDGIIFRACQGCENFNAFARRPLVIDKRGETFSRQRTQTYDCNTGNVGGCVVDGSGPIFNASGGDLTRTYPTSAVNLGDARMEGLLIHQLDIVSCQGGGGC